MEISFALTPPEKIASFSSPIVTSRPSAAEARVCTSGLSLSIFTKNGSNNAATTSTPTITPATIRTFFLFMGKPQVCGKMVCGKIVPSAQPALKLPPLPGTSSHGALYGSGAHQRDGGHVVLRIGVAGVALHRPQHERAKLIGGGELRLFHHFFQPFEAIFFVEPA